MADISIAVYGRSSRVQIQAPPGGNLSLTAGAEALHIVESLNAIRGVATVFDTSFTTAQGFITNYEQLTSPDSGTSGFNGLQTGVGNHGSWVAGGGSKDIITPDANRSGGAGGRGFRHWRSDGFDINGGGMSIAASGGPYSELWVRFYMRHQSGFAWSGGAPQFEKDQYWNTGAINQVGEFNYGYNGGGWGFRTYADVRNNIASSMTWSDLQGGSTSDGLFHCHEYHIKMDTNGSNGEGHIWIDDVLVLTVLDVDWGTGGAVWSEFILGDNQNDPANGGDRYTDYDDLAISAVGRIGLL